MKLVFTPTAWAEYTQWQKTDRTMLSRVNRLLDDTLRHPATGIGKPETLRYDLSGVWSRRITEEHRLVYLADDEKVTVIQCRFHYQR
ncbi:Txe/YoeB family addiction module toxin [Subtercola lobariae]|uniref:Endoribonuclease YoeB n=1 Tax=Subtercola lobariae TaxID=1588641 RepID=A0A917BED2_9MICO|nr:Txe/YoeB family addiction module toxin [Subtercola lobariae]GGF36585.1 toxin YoeB [Subtercola lobariae]